VPSQDEAHRAQPPTWSSAGAARLEEDDHADQDRRPGVGEDELEEAELEDLGEQPDSRAARQSDQQLHRLRPRISLKSGTAGTHDDDVNDVADADARGRRGRCG